MGHFGSYSTTDDNQTPLIANQSITLGPLQSDRAQTVSGSVFSDQPGTLYVEQSFNNGTNWDVSVAINVVANAGQGFNQPLEAPVARLRYVNGATAQGVFRLFTRTFSTS